MSTCTNLEITPPVVDKLAKASVVNDVSSELDKERDNDRAWKNELKDTISYVDSVKRQHFMVLAHNLLQQRHNALPTDYA